MSNDYPFSTTDEGGSGGSVWTKFHIQTDNFDYIGTYELIIYHDADHIALGKVVTITIRDPCEPPAKVTLPEFSLPDKYRLGTGKKPFKLPRPTVEPAKCTDGVAFDLTVPLGLSNIVVQNLDGDVVLGGMTSSSNANIEYEITIQAVTAEGLEIADASAIWKLKLDDVKKGGAQELI